MVFHKKSIFFYRFFALIKSTGIPQKSFLKRHLFKHNNGFEDAKALLLFLCHFSQHKHMTRVFKNWRKFYWSGAVKYIYGANDQWANNRFVNSWTSISNNPYFLVWSIKIKFLRYPLTWKTVWWAPQIKILKNSRGIGWRKTHLKNSSSFKK